MTCTIRILVTVSALLLATPSGASDPSPDREWPMPIAPAVSSSFCEYREGHFHAGIDIRTFGREGVACVASGDGYVSRIRASSVGYGKAIYLQLDTGETLVYAHLAEFSPELEDVVYEEQVRRESYRVDFRFSSERFPVRRGDVIGYSGMTGAAAPHLHFEVRNAAEHPMDPFDHGFGLEDQSAPVIEMVQFVPLDASAGIPFEMSVRKTGPREYALCDTVTLRGAVGLSVQVIDLLNVDSGRLAPREMELSVDGNRISRLAFERFSFNQTSHVDFVYDVGRVRREKAYFYNMFEHAGQKVWDSEFIDGGRLNPIGSGQAHEARFEARDRAGNMSELVFYFRAAQAIPQRDDPRSRGVGNFKNGNTCRHIAPDDAGFYFHGRFARASAPPYAVYRVRDALAEGDVVASGADPLGLSAVPTSVTVDKSELYLVGIEKARPRSIRFADLGTELVIGERTLFADQIIYAQRWGGRAAEVNNGELVTRAQPVQLGPYSLVLQADMEIRFNVAGADTSYAIYRMNEGKKEWVFYESVVSSGVVTTTAKRPGVYAVLSDAYGPNIRAPFARRRASYATGRVHAEIVIPIEDAGSGIDRERTTIYIGEAKAIARWEETSKKMFILLRDQNIMGPQTVSIVAFDQAGNRSRLDATVDIPDLR